MNIRMMGLGLVCALLAGTAGATYLIDDGATQYIDGNTDFGTNVLVIGWDKSGNGLRIFDNYSVWARDTYVGYADTSSSNWLVMGDNTRLLLDGPLYVGYNSDGNYLEAGDGAVIWTDYGCGIGYLEEGDNNRVTLSDNGTLWYSGGNMYVGSEGSNNRLEVKNGAEVTVSGSLWLGRYDAALNNSVLLTNDASLYVGNVLVVGYDGAGSKLQVLDGSSVINYDGFVGVTNDADNCTVLVSGAGSTWTNAGVLYIGNSDNTGNSVTVTNNGAIVVHDELRISGAGNTFNLERDGSLTVLTNFDASMGGFHFNEGGTLFVGGTLTGASSSIEGERTLSLTGANGYWDQRGNTIEVGHSSAGNALYIQDGAWVSAGNMDVGAGGYKDNLVSVAGSNALLQVAGTLSVGSPTNGVNGVTVNDSGVIMAGSVVLGGPNGSFTLGNDGWLVVSNGIDAAMPGFNFLSGGTLETLGTLSGMGNSIEEQRTILLTGGNAFWNVGTNGLQVGTTSSSNELYITGGALLASEGATIGSSSTSGNLVYVSGQGSRWTNAASLGINGYYNDLVIGNGGVVGLTQNLSVRNQASLTFESGGRAYAGSFYQDSSSVFAFESVTNDAPGTALLTVSDSAEFEDGATIEYIGTISAIERGVVFTNRLVTADTLIVGGVTNATDTDLAVLNLAGLGTLLKIDLIAENDDLLALITRMRLAESAGFDAGTDLAGVCDDLDRMADSGNALADNMLNSLSGLASSTQHAQLSQRYDRHAPTYAHTKGMLDGFRLARTRSIVPDPMLPAGPLGPHFYGRQAEGWIKGYGSLAQRDGSGSFSGYDQSTYGVALGLDKSYGDLLAGFAGGMALTQLSQDDGDNSDATTYYGVLYASWGTLSWFGDFNLGYGHSAIKDSSGTLYNTTAEYAGDQLGFYLGGGKEMLFLDEHLFFTPSAALSGSYYLQQGYTERSTTSVPRSVDDYDYLSLQSEVGVKISYSRNSGRSAFVPDVHANWMHEFNADEERIGYSLVGGSGGYTFGMAAPVEDLYELGFGLTWWRKTRNRSIVEWSLGLDGRMGDGYTEAIGNLQLMTRF